MSPTKDYRAILRTHLEDRIRVNSHYSMRAFARDLGLSPSRLSQILNHRLGLSQEAAAKLAKGLSLSEKEAHYFCELVKAEDARSKTQRQLAQKAVVQFEKMREEMHTLNDDVFKALSDWYHFALVELYRVHPKSYNEDAKTAKAFGVSVVQVREAKDRLLRLKLIEKDKSAIRVSGVFTTTNEVPSQAIRTYHKQILAKAAQAIEMQGVEERDFSGVVFPMRKSDIPKFKEEIRQFRRKIQSEALSHATKDSDVHCLSIQFFRLTNRGVK